MDELIITRYSIFIVLIFFVAYFSACSEDDNGIDPTKEFEANGRGLEWNYILEKPEDILPWLWS